MNTQETAGNLTLAVINGITERIIGCAIEVHKQLGPGLLEQTYETAMCIELQESGLTFERQPAISIQYKGSRIGEHRADLIVANMVVVELKSVERFDPVFAAQILTYLRCTGLKVGLLINFNGPVLRSGIRRFIL
jgi:GxxExxY protein